LKSVADLNAARNRLSADMADDLQRVKALVVRAEDSRLLNDMVVMRRAYTDLHALNNQLVGGYNIRAANHEGLLAALKEVNQTIQRAANLRVGRAKTSVISECRAAVKANNLSLLFSLVKSGKA
jgi:Bardet-Biedl syndrome 2 protein